ncbi:MAG: AsmA family protein, partial [Deltaproteobacteria bacterium]|nr:AsmA family protein [Deltaproteobacteria bacterium]
MARALKYIGIGVAVLAGIVLLAVVAVNLIPGDTYKSLIASGVQSATGREMVIEGDLDIDLFTTFSFRASGVKLANPAWASRPHMATVDHIEAELALFPLLAGVLDFSLIVKKPDLLLEQNSSGQGNWQFAEPAEAPAEKETTAEAEAPQKAPGLPLRPVVRNLLVSEARIVFQDAQRKEQFRIHGESIRFDPAEGELTVRVDGHAKKIPIALTGGFEDVKTVGDKVTAKVRFDGHFGDAKLALTGSVGPFFPAAEMDVTVDVGVDSAADFSALAGRDLPDLGPLSVSVQLTGEKGTYRIEKMV